MHIECALLTKVYFQTTDIGLRFTKLLNFHSYLKMLYLFQTVDIVQCRIFRVIYIDDNSKRKQANFLYICKVYFC